MEMNIKNIRILVETLMILTYGEKDYHQSAYKKLLLKEKVNLLNGCTVRKHKQTYSLPDDVNQVINKQLWEKIHDFLDDWII